MTGTSSVAVEAVRAAMSASRPEDIIDGVKDAITDELVRLDPSVKIIRTTAFNHTYIPDLIARWPDKAERPVFLRGSLGAVVDSDDVESLADREPVLVGLVDETPAVLERLQRRITPATRSLATEVSSVARIATHVPSGPTVRADSQLSGLVRANLVRGGRGILTGAEADLIDEVEAADPAQSLEAFKDTVSSLFVGDTAERLSRTAALLSDLFEDEVGQSLAQLSEEGLSDSELGLVLPYVLQRAVDVRDRSVWTALGSLLTLDRLESMSQSLAGYDLTPLIAPVAATMMGARATVYFSPDELTEEQMDARDARWTVRSSRLSADVGRWAFFVASDKRKIRARDDGSEARWDELATPLQPFALASIDLHGLTRKLSVSNDDARYVRSDVERIRDTIEDDFHVSQLSVRESSEDDALEVNVDFVGVTVSGQASISFLLRAANLLARKRPFAERDLRRLLAN